MTRTATIRRGKIKTSDSNAPIEQAGKPADDRLASLLPSDMSTAQLRTILKANGIAYSGKDRKADLVFKAQQLRYGPNEREGAAVVEPDSATCPDCGKPRGVGIQCGARPGSYCEPIKPLTDPVERIAEAIISGEVSFVEAATEILTRPEPVSFMAEAVAATAPEPAEPQAIEVTDGASRNARTAAAREEHAALKAWSIGQGIMPDASPKPATPNLDAVEAESKHPGGKPGKPRTGASPVASTKTAKEVTVRFEIDGKPVGATQNRLSAISRVTATADAPRWPAPQLRAWLVEQGITEPETSAWSIELPNGRTIGATLPA